jgi:hypothetical protein
MTGRVLTGNKKIKSLLSQKENFAAIPNDATTTNHQEKQK